MPSKGKVTCPSHTSKLHQFCPKVFTDKGKRTPDVHRHSFSLLSILHSAAEGIFPKYKSKHVTSFLINSNGSLSSPALNLNSCLALKALHNLVPPTIPVPLHLISHSTLTLWYWPPGCSSDKTALVTPDCPLNLECPLHLCLLASLGSFKFQLKSHLPQKAFPNPS